MNKRITFADARIVIEKLVACGWLETRTNGHEAHALNEEGMVALIALLLYLGGKNEDSARFRATQAMSHAIVKDLTRRGYEIDPEGWE